MDATTLQRQVAGLPPWRYEPFDDDDWATYVSVARAVQQSSPETVEAALEHFLREARSETFQGYESESKPFLLMRVVFDLPEVAPESERQSFKGWDNWPPPDADGRVSLAWPLSWQSGRPELVARYEGSQGLPYAAVEEYRHMRAHYPYRELTRG